MKKNKLIYNYDIDYHALALVTAVNDYRMTHFLNKITNYKFKKKTGLKIDLPELSDCIIDYYIFKEANFNLNIILLKNKQIKNLIFKKFKNIDYFLLIEQNDQNSSELLKDLQTQLSQLSIIQAIFVVENNQLNLKNKIHFE